MPLPPDVASAPSAGAPPYQKVRDPIVPDALVTYIIPLGNGRFGRWTVDARDATPEMDADADEWARRKLAEYRCHLRLA